MKTELSGNTGTVPSQKKATLASDGPPIRVLHLSDLHFSAKTAWDSDTVLGRLAADVAKLRKEIGEIDLVVVTGDIADFGTANEYNQAAAWLTGPLATAAGVTTARIRVVPGNHDVDRGSITRTAKALTNDLLRDATPQQAIAEVLDNPNERAPLLARQAAYLTFAQIFHPGRAVPWWSERPIIRGLTVHLAGFNSAWLSASNADRGSLLLSRWQCNQLLAGADEADLTIALLHHPWDYLAEHDKQLVEEEIRRRCGVILHGHLHEQKARLTSDPDRDVLLLAAGASYAGSQWANAYQLLELDPVRGEARVHFRLWDGHDWIADRNRYKKAPDGVATLSLRRSPRVPSLNSSAPPEPHEGEDTPPLIHPRQVNAAGWGQITLPLRGLRPLPPQTWFTGREAELKRLRAWLHSPGQAVLSSVQGEGGVGKTELARKVAALAAEEGLPVAWLQLTGQPRRALVERLIQTVEADFRAGDRDDAYLEAELRRALGDARGLLVLDDAEEGATVEALRPGPSWNVLVTTRVQRLLPGVHPLELDRLNENDALLLLARVTWDAEEIPGPEHADAKILVGRLERLPLAIELAGRSLRETGETVGTYLEALDQGLGRAADDRARIAAVLARSFGRLSAASAMAFEALAALPAVGASLEQIAVVLGQPEPDVERALRPLVCWSIAQFRPDTGRYRLHAHVREYGRRRAREAGRATALAEGVAAAMASTLRWVDAGKTIMVEIADARWAAVRDQVEAWQPDGLERGSAAATAASEAISLADQFRQFYLSTKARLDWIQRALDMVAPWAEHIRAMLLRNRGDLRHFQNDLSGAEEDFAEALSLFVAVGDPLAQANVLEDRGDLRRSTGDLLGAEEDYESALALCEAAGSRLGQASVLRARGDLRRMQDDLTGAEKDYADAMALFVAVGDPVGQANVLYARGELGLLLNDVSGAEEDYAAALTLYEVMGSRLGQANVLMALGDLQVFQADRSRAESSDRGALVMDEAEDDRADQVNVRQARGHIDQPGGHLREAQTHYLEALAIYKQEGDRWGQSNVFASLAQLFALAGDATQAAKSAELALELGRVAHNQYATQVAEHVLAWAEEEREE
jgi:tetratricopeptide (TPR) repeat protein/predicted phosphodiesterase